MRNGESMWDIHHRALSRLLADLQEPDCTIKLRRKRRKKRNQKYLYIRDMY